MLRGEKKLGVVTPHFSPMEIIHYGEDSSKPVWLYSAMTPRAITASPMLWGSLWAEPLLKIRWPLDCRRKHLLSPAHAGFANQKNPPGWRAGVKGEKNSMKEERVWKPCRTGEKAEKNPREEQIIKSRLLQSLVLRYLFLDVVSSKLQMLCKHLYTSLYYLSVNCIDSNVLINES